MKTIERKLITCRRCGRGNTCTCAFNVKSMDWKARTGVCKQCALGDRRAARGDGSEGTTPKESTLQMQMNKGVNPALAARQAKAEANKPLLSYSGFNNAENSAILQKLARSFGCRYHWDGLKDNVHHTAERHKNAAMVAIWNGNQFTTPLVAKLCKKRGIPHFFFEQGMLPQSKTFLVDPQGFCGDSILNGDLSWVTDADMERLYAKRAELQKQYPRRDEGFILAPLQIHNDSQVLYYSHYRNMDEFVADVEALYPDTRIVARPHPKGGKKHTFARAEEIFKGDFLSWAARASRVVGITSTCLYEAAILGVPVQALGDHPFATHPPELHDKVAAGALALCIPRNGDMRVVLDRFGYKPLVNAEPQAAEPVAAASIPKILHHVWLGGEPMPEEFQYYRRGWMEKHPGWEFKLWTDDNLPTMANRALFDAAQHGAEKSDILRLELLHQFGGLYVDTDFECVKNVEPLLNEASCVLARMPEPNGKPPRMTSAFMACAPGDAFFAHCIKSLPGHIARNPKNGLPNKTGPYYISRFVASFPHIRVLSPGIVYPYGPRTLELKDKWYDEGAAAFPEAYAVHHFDAARPSHWLNKGRYSAN